MVQIVGAGTNAVGAAIDEEQVFKQIIRDMTDEIAQAQALARQVFTSSYKEFGIATLGNTEAVYGVFGRSTTGRLKAARAAFKTEARGQFNLGMKQWTDKFRGQSEVLRQEMQQVLINAQLHGWDQRTIAENLLRQPSFQFKNLPELGQRGRRLFTMGGKLSPSDALVRRANMIARTEMNGVQNRMHRSWTKAAGFDLYINMNGQPVSDECIAANAAGAQTWEQWSKGLGIPPRHPNCDSGLLAVPENYKNTEIQPT